MINSQDRRYFRKQYGLDDMTIELYDRAGYDKFFVKKNGGSKMSDKKTDLQRIRMKGED